MRHIGTTFASYTYTDISTGFFEEAQTVFANQAGKMIFKALDVEKEISEQGYVEHSYDLVIGSLVLHATRDLRKTLTNTRRLLKPGGYLLIQEITNLDVLRVGFAMSGLPGWWLGRESGRRYSPCVTSAEWHSLLLETGFSGIDSITPEIDLLPRPLSIITAQATNEQIDFLRQPLLYPGESLGTSTVDLVVIGGQSLRTIVLIDELTRLLQPWQFSVNRVRSLHELHASQISPTSLVLSVTELDQPIWENFSPDTMGGLKYLMDFQRTILWVTQGCRSEQPYMNMSVGLGRTLLLEMPDLRLQFMDLDASEKPNPQLLAEALMRLQVTGALENPTDGNSILWSTEQEIAYENGRQIIPRLRVNQKQNDRYNASKKTIMQSKNAEDCRFHLDQSGSRYILTENHLLDDHATDPRLSQGVNVDVQVTYSLLKPIKIADGDQAYIVFGHDLTQGERLVALSRVHGNCVTISKDQLMPCNVSPGMEPQFLATLEIELQANRMMLFCAQNARVLIYEPNPEVAVTLASRAAEKNLAIWFLSSTKESVGDGWLAIHPRAPSRTIKAALPQEVSVFIDCSPDATPDSLGRLVSNCLPSWCLRASMSDVNAHVGRVKSSEQTLMKELNIVTNRALLQVDNGGLSTHKPTPPNIITPGDTAGLITSEAHDATIIEWPVNGTISLRLSSVESQTHFAGNKTYVFFGLTSDLGTSLCDWFVSRGARNLVLTSRNPKIDSRWLEQMKTAGARVEVFAK